jgi:hypothetical protein
MEPTKEDKPKAVADDVFQALPMPDMVQATEPIAPSAPPAEATEDPAEAEPPDSPLRDYVREIQQEFEEQEQGGGF